MDKSQEEGFRWSRTRGLSLFQTSKCLFTDQTLHIMSGSSQENLTESPGPSIAFNPLVYAYVRANSDAPGPAPVEADVPTRESRIIRYTMVHYGTIMS